MPDDDQTSHAATPPTSGFTAESNLISEEELLAAMETARIADGERAAVSAAIRDESQPVDPDEVLAGGSDEELLAHADPDASLVVSKTSASDDTGGLDELIAELTAENVPVDARETRILPDDAERSKVVRENVAAAAVDKNVLPSGMLDELVGDAGGSSKGSADPAPDEGAAVPQELLDDLLAEVEVPAQSRKGDAPAPRRAAPTAPSSPRSVRSMMADRNSVRMIASITIGLLSAVAVFMYLNANRLRPLSEADISSALKEGGLESAIRNAREWMDDGRHADAADELSRALTGTAPSALKVDAEFLLLEAVFHTLPAKLEPNAAAAFHSEADRLLEVAPMHLSAPLALYFNAKVMEAEANPLAARALYRNILRDYPDAANADDVLLAAGQLELKLERPVEAAEYFERLVAEYPGSPLVERARLHAADALQMAGNYDGARVQFVRLAQSHPGTPLGDEAFERLGALAFETGDYESAIRELESRLTNATTIEGNDRVYLLLARTYAASGNPEKALELLCELVDFFPESDVMPLAHVELARVQSLMGMDREAVRTATQAMDRYPEHPAVLRNAGEMLARADRPDAAALAYQNAYRAGEDDPELLLEAGKLFREAEQFGEAERVLNDVQLYYATAPEALEAAIEWSRLKYDQGEVTVAFDRLEGLAEVTRDRAQQLKAKSALAALYEDIGFTTEAARIYGEIPELTSEPSMLAQSAAALFAAGKAEEALDIVERIEVARLSDPEAYELLTSKGKALMLGDLRYALDTLETAHETYPQQRTPEGDALLLRANLAAGRPARARAVIVDMRTRFAGDADAQPWLTIAANEWGDFLYERRDYRAAADAYAYALPDSPDAIDGDPQTWALYQRANALYKIAAFEECLQLYEQVSSTSSPWAKEAVSKIEAVKLDMKLRGKAVPEFQEAG